MRRQSKTGSIDDARSIHLLSQDEILSLFCDIVSGLAFLHEHNMLHLDIKAENILLHRVDGDESFLCVSVHIVALHSLMKQTLQTNSNAERFWIGRST